MMPQSSRAAAAGQTWWKALIERMVYDLQNYFGN
jgi:hypothetical protein